jgi:5-carboxymethyl-2-hydroxymuconic-semialdehyde dehydrogenase
MATPLDDNLQAAHALLARFRASTLPHWINGAPHVGASGQSFDNLTPIDNSLIGKVAAGNAADVDIACRAAQTAFPAWRDLPGEARKALLHKVADAIEARARDIALVESYDCGQALRFMSKAAVRGAENFRFFADRAPGARDGQSLPADEHSTTRCASRSARSA